MAPRRRLSIKYALTSVILNRSASWGQRMGQPTSESIGAGEPLDQFLVPPYSSLLTASRIGAALQRSGALAADRSVRGVRVQPLGVGKAMMSTLLRLHLEYDVPGAGPASIVAKLACDNPFRRSVADRFDFYDREVFFYDRVAASVPFRVPGCHLAERNEAIGAPLLLLEDLGDLSVSQTSGCAWDQAILVVSELARFHARWWGGTSQYEADVHAVNSSRYLDNVRRVFADAWPSCRRLAGDRMPSELLLLGDRWAEDVVAPVAEMIASPATLCHGDLRLDNLRFVDGSLVVFDFQLVVRSNGVADLAYFASQSIPTELRTGRDEELVRCYLAELAANSVRYDFAEAWEVYRAATLFMLLFPVVLYQAFEELPDAGRDLTATMLDRSVAAIIDTQALNVVARHRQ